jgi:ribosomal protein S18 acetylase RimI-like enzyme
VLEEQVFNPKVHDRNSFQCGEPALDTFLRQYAAQQVAQGVASVFLLVDDATPSKIQGFYTLSAAQIDAARLRPAEQKKLPRYTVPCIRMRRLARDLQCRGQGVGEILIGLAVNRCRKALVSIAAYALIVDAKNASAKSFYAHYGFIACIDAPMTLYLPIR